MEGIVMVRFDDDGLIAFTPKAFEEQQEEGLQGVMCVEHWVDKREAKKRYPWLV